MRCYGKGKPTEFLNLQPNGNLPCAIIDGAFPDEKRKVISESNDIIDALDELSITITGMSSERTTNKNIPTLRPSDKEDIIRVLERRLYARWM